MAIIAIIFFIAGWRSISLAPKHYAWVAGLTLVSGLSNIGTALKRAKMSGLELEVTPLSVVGYVLYVGAIYSAALLIGFWLGGLFRLNREIKKLANTRTDPTTTEE